MVYHSRNENTEMCEKLIPEVIYSQKCHINTHAIPEIYKFIIILNVESIRISEEVTA